MCLLIVCTFDHHNRTLQSTDDNWKRGDIVEVMEDGADPGLGIINSNAFRIINVPGVPAAKYINMISAETVTITDHLKQNLPSVTSPIRKRHFTFDLTSAELAAGKASTANLTWPAIEQGHLPIQTAEANLVPFTTAKPPLPSADIITDLGLPPTDVVTPIPSPIGIVTVAAPVDPVSDTP